MQEVVKGSAESFTRVARREYVYGGALSIGGGLVRLKPEGGGVPAEQVYLDAQAVNRLGPPLSGPFHLDS